MEITYSDEQTMLQDLFPNGYKITDPSNDLYNCIGYVCHELVPHVYTTMDNLYRESDNAAIRESGGHFDLVREYTPEHFGEVVSELQNRQAIVFVKKEGNKRKIIHAAIFDKASDQDMPFESKLDSGNSPRVKNRSIDDLIRMAQRTSENELTHIQVFKAHAK